jgi:AraC-like DNA-binding protein
VEPELMARFAAYVVERRATYLRTLGACGLIVEPSALLTAAVIAGLPTMADAPSPFRAFSSIAEALIAFGADGALAITFEALQGAAAAEGALLQALAEWLRGHLHDASVAGAARALAVSVRTLQRQLNRLGTSFRREQERARVAAAQSLLMNTDDKVQVIAVAVGLEKAQHLALLFRRWTGMSPAAWRAERRGGVVEGE